MDVGPAFFKFISATVNAERKMLIPEAFSPQMRTLSKYVVLRDCYKNTWVMEVSNVGNYLYFDNNWMNFHTDNSIEIGDILEFEYKGNNLFDFKLYGLDAYEKKGLGGPPLQFNEDIHEEIPDEDAVQEIEVVVGEDEEVTESEGSDESEDTDDEEENDESEEEDYVEIDEEQAKTSKNKCRASTSNIRRPGIKYGDVTIPIKRPYKRADAPDCYGVDILEAAQIQEPKNPYFVTRTRTGSRENELYIPKEVITDYNMSLPEKIYVVDGTGRKWNGKIIQWGDGRVWLSGWREFHIANHIKRDDVCICEFVKANARQLELRVTNLAR